MRFVEGEGGAHFRDDPPDAEVLRALGERLHAHIRPEERPSMSARVYGEVT